MASGHNDPKLLYAINGVSAYHIVNGNEESLTPGGPQTLSLLMVPTSSPFADVSVDPQSGNPEEDFYLHLHLPPELDLPLPATTQIYHQPPRSYLIPRWDLGRDNGTFTRIEFPEAGSRKGLQEDVDTFETILAQCTAFLERAPPPKIVTSGIKGEMEGNIKGEKTALAPHHLVATNGGSSSSPPAPPSSRTKGRSKSKATYTHELPAYNPANFKPGEGYVRGSYSQKSADAADDAPAGGQIVLINEDDGSVIGELNEGFKLVEDSALKPGSKDPVEITLPIESSQTIGVAPASKESVEFLMHPAYQKSFLVSRASAASRLIVSTSDKVSKALQAKAAGYTEKTEGATEPITFKPITHEHVRRINTFTDNAVVLSAKTVGNITKVAQNLGATLVGHTSKKVGKGGGGKGFDKDGNVIENYKPGILNKSLMAFSTVADGIDQAGRNLLTSTSSAATTVVSHKWGPDAGEVTRHVGSGVKNVGLVYIDVTGVSRRALIKSVAKGMVVGRAPGGGDLIVGSGDGGTMPPEMGLKDSEKNNGNGSSPATSVLGSKVKKLTLEDQIKDKDKP